MQCLKVMLRYSEGLLCQRFVIPKGQFTPKVYYSEGSILQIHIKAHYFEGSLLQIKTRFVTLKGHYSKFRSNDPLE